MGGGHRPGHTMVGFVGGCEPGKGYMMSAECWPPSTYASPAVFMAFITPSHSWPRRRESGTSRWCAAFLVNNVAENHFEGIMYFKKDFNESYMSEALAHFPGAPSNK